MAAAGFSCGMRGVVTQELLGLLQDVAHLLGPHAGELLKEVIHRAPVRQGIEQRFHGNASPGKARRSALNLRVDQDGRFAAH